jgi:hypothetical protein
LRGFVGLRVPPVFGLVETKWPYFEEKITEIAIFR